MYIISKSKPCTYCIFFCMSSDGIGTNPNIPECSLAGISLLLIMGSLIAMHFFPFELVN